MTDPILLIVNGPDSRSLHDTVAITPDIARQIVAMAMGEAISADVAWKANAEQVRLRMEQRIAALEAHARRVLDTNRRYLRGLIPVGTVRDEVEAECDSMGLPPLAVMKITGGTVGSQIVPVKVTTDEAKHDPPAEAQGDEDAVAASILALLVKHAHGDYESSAKMLADAIRRDEVPSIKSEPYTGLVPISLYDEQIGMREATIAALRAELEQAAAQADHWKARFNTQCDVEDRDGLRLLALTTERERLTAELKREIRDHTEAVNMIREKNAELEQAKRESAGKDRTIAVLTNGMPELQSLLRSESPWNYTEITGQSPEGVQFVITCQRHGRPSPHEKRMEAEAARDRALAELAKSDDRATELGKREIELEAQLAALRDELAAEREQLRTCQKWKAETAAELAQWKDRAERAEAWQRADENDLYGARCDRNTALAQVATLAGVLARARAWGDSPAPHHFADCHTDPQPSECPACALRVEIDTTLAVLNEVAP